MGYEALLIYTSVSGYPKHRQQAFWVAHYVSGLYSVYTLITENSKCVRDQILCAELFYYVSSSISY